MVFLRLGNRLSLRRDKSASETLEIYVMNADGTALSILPTIQEMTFYLRGFSFK